jgi:hypothetical protein
MKHDGAVGGFLKRRLVVGDLTAGAKKAVANTKDLNLPTFLDNENEQDLEK